jgi:hypothetical protein
MDLITELQPEYREAWLDEYTSAMFIYIYVILSTFQSAQPKRQQAYETASATDLKADEISIVDNVNTIHI